MYFTPVTVVIAVVFVLLAVAAPATYATYLAKRALAPYRKRRVNEQRTLAWYHLALVVAYVLGGLLAVVTWGLIDLVVIPAAIADLSITSYTRRAAARAREAARRDGFVIDEPVDIILPRAIVRGGAR